MRKVKLCKEEIQKAKVVKGIPFVVTYHRQLKNLGRIINKNVYLLNMNEKTKKVFSLRPIVSFRSSRKISSYLVRAKLYPLDRVVGSTECGKKRCEICMNVSETNTFIEHITASFIFRPVSVVENNMLGKEPTTLGIDGITIRIMIESILVRRTVCKNICLNILTTWDTVVSLTMFQ